MNQNIDLLAIISLNEICKLTEQLNSNLDKAVQLKRQTKMFEFENYRCFGFYNEEKLIGVMSGWITVRLYSGKQIEIDNVVIDESLHGKGYGKSFINLVQEWAQDNGCVSMELNTYIENSKSHKFYFNEGYRIMGLHMQKDI
jgi:GNAT superfamily N-acetyltransferase